MEGEHRVFERRKKARFSLSLPITVNRLSGPASSIEGRTINISSCGVLFRAATSLRAGESVEFLISLLESGSGGPSVLRAFGRIVRVGQAERQGLCFASSFRRYEISHPLADPSTEVEQEQESASFEA